MMLDLVTFFILAPLFLVIYGLIVFFDLVGTGIEYILIIGAVLLTLSIIVKGLHFTFSTLFGKVGETIISVILAIPMFAVSLSIAGIIAVCVITLLAFPFVFITGALGVSWVTLLSVIACIICIVFVSWHYSAHKTNKT